jgi:hypothetical protein
MSNCQRALSTCLAVLLIAGACDSEAPSPPADENLLPNGSFEIQGAPTFAGWSAANGDLTSLVTGTAPDGGAWCLELTADWAPPTALVTAPIPVARDGEAYRLSAYVRAVPPAGGGSIAFVIGSGDRRQQTKAVATVDTLWMRLALVDTLALAPGDSAWVQLSALPTEIVPLRGQFDLVTLERLEP